MIRLRPMVAFVCFFAAIGAVPADAQETDAERLAANCVGTTAGVIIETVDFVTVDGETVRACLGLPASGDPAILVTATHGIGHVVQESWVHHIERIVADHGVAMVALNYRDNFGFPTLRGAEDTIVITRQLLERFPSITQTVLLSVSMGASVGGVALAEAPRFNGGEPLWNHWVVAEGVSNLAETYAEAAAAASVSSTAARAKEGIERETGGTPAEVPEEYRLRSPIFRTDEIASAIETSAFVHAANDGLVGFHQGASMAAALCAAGIHTAFDPITTGSGERDDSTLLDLISADLEDANDSTVDLSGHGSEADAAHPVMMQTFARLDQLLAGETYDSGCALAIAAEGVSRPSAGDPDNTASTPTTTSSTTAPASRGTSTAETLAATGSSVPTATALLLAMLGLVGASSARRLRSSGSETREV